MRKIIPLFTSLIFLLTFNQLKAQEAIIVSDTLEGWNYSWIVGLNGSQAAYSNWSKGGVNNISVNANSAVSAMYREGRFAYGSILETRYGKSRIADQGTRKTNDLLAFRNRFTYDLARNSDWSLFGDVNFRTQFDKGYEYDEGPNEEDILISGFFAPAYISESAGLLYKPSDFFSFQGGLGLKQTIVTDGDLETLYGLNEGDTFRNEAGITLGASYQQALFENFILSSRLETFTNLKRPVSSTDVLFSNQFTGKVNNFMNVSLQFDLVFDDDYSEEVQILQVLSLGVSFALI